MNTRRVVSTDTALYSALLTSIAVSIAEKNIDSSLYSLIASIGIITITYVVVILRSEPMVAQSAEAGHGLQGSDFADTLDITREAREN